MSKIIILLWLFLASVILPLQSYAFSVFDEGRVNEQTRKRLGESSNKVDFLNRVYFDVFARDDRNASATQNEVIRSSARVDLVSQLHYNKKWFIYTNFRVEEQGLVSNEFRSLQATPANGEDQSFQDHAGVVRELNFGYEDDDYKVFAGKFRPKFGYAWNLGRGVFTNSLSSSYMQSERIGFGGEVKAGDKRRTGAYNLGVSFYKYDRKYLDNSMLTSRTEVKQNQAVASDTKNPDSFTVHLDIDFDLNSGKELFYRFAYSKQKFDRKYLVNNSTAETPYEDQQAYSLTMNYKVPFSKNFSLDSLVEYADTEFLEGGFGVNKDSVTNVSAIANICKNWNITGGVAERRILATAGGITAKTLESELTVGYNFDKSDYFDGLQIKVGLVELRDTVTAPYSLDERRGGVALLRYVKWL